MTIHLFTSEERIRSGIKKLEKNMAQSTQCRIDSFFKKNGNSIGVAQDTNSSKVVCFYVY